MPSVDSSLRLTELTFSTVAVSPKTAWILVRVTLSDGTQGFAEASDFANTASVESDLALLAAAVHERQPRPIGPVLALLGGRQVSVARRAARSGVEAALLDALARRAGVPLATLLGGPYRDELPTYANINRGIPDRSPDGFAARARDVVKQEGYTALKIAPFDGYRWDSAPDVALLETGLRRIAAVREAVGPQVRILIDCHGRFSPATASLVIREAAAFNPFWIEEPVDAERVGPREQRELRAQAHRHAMRMAGGEQLETLEQARRLLGQGSCDVILPDLRTTGIRDGLAILELAVSSGVEASLHNPAGPLLDATSRHVAAAASSFLILERQVRESPLYDTLAGGSIALSSGCLPLDGSPGTGLDIDWDSVTAASGVSFERRLDFTGLPGAGGDG